MQAFEPDRFFPCPIDFTASRISKRLAEAYGARFELDNLHGSVYCYGWVCRAVTGGFERHDP